MSSTTVDGSHAGVVCPYCSSPLAVGDPAWECDSCSTVHHADCWQESGGCTVLGCADSTLIQPYMPEVRSDVLAEVTQASATVPKSIVVSISAVAVTAVIAIGAIIISQTSGAGDPVAPAASASHERESKRERPAESESMSARRIVRTMRDYAGAFASSDRAGLSRLFPPTVQRWGIHGPSTDPCFHDVGRSNVLDAYTSQFANVSSYELDPTSIDIVELTSVKRGRARTNYVINGGTPGAIKFSFERSESAGWRISRVVVGKCE